MFDLLTQEVTPRTGRFLTLTVDTAQAPLKIIAVYAPHNGRELEDRVQFWEELEEIIQETPDSTALVLTGDFNAQACWDHGDAGRVAGPSGSPVWSTEAYNNEELLLGLMQRH